MSRVLNIRLISSKTGLTISYSDTDKQVLIGLINRSNWKIVNTTSILKQENLDYVLISGREEHRIEKVKETSISYRY